VIPKESALSANQDGKVHPAQGKAMTAAFVGRQLTSKMAISAFLAMR